jgi:CheY-like chemotaxis protein
MGGQIWAESQPGEGSTFHFTIMADEVDAPRRSTDDGHQLELTGKRVLIVDDNRNNRRILKLQTERWGMLARETDSPTTALGWINQGDPFDVVLVDYQMPEMDGIALARTIRAMRGSHSPILILLSSVGQSLIAEHAQVGFAAVLSKPLKLSHLRDRLLETVAQPGEPKPSAFEPAVEGVCAAAAPLRILLAEDNEFNQKVATRLLQRLDYRADIANNGREALARLDHTVYDVILMDVQMPELDGLETSRIICSRWPPSRRPRIIAMTAEAMQGDREKCLAAGMDDYIVKPVTLEQLGTALAKCQPRREPAAHEAPAAAVCLVEGIESVDDTALDPTVLNQVREDLGGTAPLREIILTFLEKTPSVLAALHDAAVRADAGAIRQAAHMLKGTSAMLGARALAEQCAELELLGGAGIVADALDRVTAIEALYPKVETALKAAVESPASLPDRPSA